MRRAHITITEREGLFDADMAGVQFGIKGAATAEEAIGRLVLLLSHPMGIKIHKERANSDEG